MVERSVSVELLDRSLFSSERDHRQAKQKKNKTHGIRQNRRNNRSIW
jgi:hypothetical protein